MNWTEWLPIAVSLLSIGVQLHVKTEILKLELRVNERIDKSLREVRRYPR